MPYQLDLKEKFLQGSVLSFADDQLPDGSFRLLKNMRLSRTEGVPTLRPGVSSLTLLPIDSGYLTVPWIGKLYSRAADYTYEQVQNGIESRLYRLTSGWSTPVFLSSTPDITPFSDVNWLDGGTKSTLGVIGAPGVWKFLVGCGRGKDNGTVLQDIGIAAPTAPPASATLGTRQRIVLHNMDAIAGWVGAGLAGGPTADTAIKQEGTASISMSIAPDSLGSIALGFATVYADHTGTHDGAANNVSLVDASENFITAGIKRGAKVRNTVDNCEGVVTRVTATELFFDGGLTGGVDNDFDVGDTYDIYFNLETFAIEKASGTNNSGFTDETDRFSDTTKDFWVLGIRPGMRVWNTTNGTTGLVTSIGTLVNNNDTLICSAGFSGAAENDFDTGDGYVVHDELVKDDDYVHAWVRVDFPEKLDWLQIDLDRDTSTLAGAFVTNYYSVRLPSSQYLTQGRDVWTELKIPKSQFTKQGTEDDWKDIRAIRISGRTSRAGGCTIWADDLSLIGGYGIAGMIEYAAIYENAATGGISNPPLTQDDQVLHTMALEVDRAPVVVSLANIDNPVDTQITRIRLYRRGGTLAQWTFVDSVADSASTFTDTYADQTIALNESLETDNHLIPNTAVVLFGPGGYNRLFAIVDRNKVHYSKAWEAGRSRGENWPRFSFFLVGDGSREALNGIVLDTNGYVYTEEACFFFTGRDKNTFIPIPIPQSRGLAGRYALDGGDGQVFFYSQDGIYAQKGPIQVRLTDGIKSLFSGETVAGVAPIATAYNSACRLKFLPDPNDPMLIFTYRSTETGNPYRALILKKNAQTGQYTDAFFDTHGNTQMQSLYVDLVDNQLLAAGTNGRVYRLENPAVTSDDGAVIAIDLWTPAHHQGGPRHRKTYNQVVLEANTGGQPLTVTAYYDKQAHSTALGTINTNSDDDQALITTGLPSSQHYNISLRVQGNALLMVKLFRYSVHYLARPEGLTYWDSGEITFPTRQVLRHLLMDIDATDTTAILVTVDGTALPLHAIAATTGRERVDVLITQTVATLRRGSVFQLTLTSAESFQVYGIQGTFESEPQRVTFWESQEQVFDRLTVLRRLEFDLDAPSASTIDVYVSGILSESQPLAATSGRQRVAVMVPAGLRGLVFTVALTSSTAFQIFGAWGKYTTLGVPRTPQVRQLGIQAVGGVTPGLTQRSFGEGTAA